MRVEVERPFSLFGKREEEVVEELGTADSDALARLGLNAGRSVDIGASLVRRVKCR